MFKKTSAPYPSMNNHIGQPIAVSEIKDIPLKKKKSSSQLDCIGIFSQNIYKYTAEFHHAKY